MKIRTWQRFIKEGFRNVFRNSVMSIASIVAIMASLFILGCVMIIVFNLKHIAGDIESRLEVTIFLKDAADYNDIKSIENQIKNWEGVYEVDFVSKAEALERWKEELGDKRDLLEGYSGENNPLPNSFILKISKPEFVEDVVKKAQLIPYCEKVNYSKEVADFIGRIVNITRVVGTVIVLILAVISIIIINNTIRISVYSRRKEINIMKYIGATDWYIRWPFIIEGFIIGVTGSLLSVALVGGLYEFLVRKGLGLEGKFFAFFRFVPVDEVIGNVLFIFLAVGCSVGIIASIISVSKHLKV